MNALVVVALSSTLSSPAQVTPPVGAGDTPPADSGAATVAPPDATAVAPSDVVVPTPSAATNDGRKLVAVLDLKATGDGAAAWAASMSTVLASEVGALGAYRSISRNEIKSVLAHAADAALVGCDDARCAADVAELVKADLIVSGELSRVGGATVVTLSLIDVLAEGGPQVVARQDVSFRGADADLMLLARPLAQRLLDGPNAQNHRGALEVFTTDGAAVIVDGQERGKAPLAPLRDLTTGVHTVLLQKDGFSPATFNVVIARNETTVGRADLVETPLIDQPWFWAAAGGVALLTAGTVTGITTWAVISQEQPTRVTLGKMPE